MARKSGLFSSLRVSAFGRRGQLGLTIVEVQVAMMLGAVGFLMIVDYARVQSQLIESIETDAWADGSVSTGDGRALLIATDTGTSAGNPACEIRLTEIDTSGLYPLVEVVVRQRGL